MKLIDRWAIFELLANSSANSDRFLENENFDYHITSQRISINFDILNRKSRFLNVCQLLSYQLWF